MNIEVSPQRSVGEISEALVMLPNLVVNSPDEFGVYTPERNLLDATGHGVILIRTSGGEKQRYQDLMTRIMNGEEFDRSDLRVNVSLGRIREHIYSYLDSLQKEVVA